MYLHAQFHLLNITLVITMLRTFQKYKNRLLYIKSTITLICLDEIHTY